MKKWMIVLAGVLLLMAGILTVTATAADVVASGECGDKGDNVTWTLDSDGLLIISGIGDMKNFYRELDTPFYGRRIKTVSIQYGITSIGSCMFHGYSSYVNGQSTIAKITIPDSVTKIGDYAFAYCPLLTDIKIPDSVTYIGEHAFEGCGNLNNIILPNGISSINRYTFTYCAKLSISIPHGVTSIGASAFLACSFLPESVKLGRARRTISNSIQAK